MGEREKQAPKPKTGEPVLKPDVAKVRAQHAVDSAVSRTASELLKTNTPPASEIAAVKKMVSDALSNSKEGETVDVGNIVEEYIGSNPKSKIAYLYKLTGGSTDWLVSSSGSVAFNSTEFSKNFKTYVSKVKDRMVDIMVKVASDNTQRSGFNDLSSVLDDSAAKILVSQLASQVSAPGAKDPLPMDVTYDSGKAMYASRTEPPETRYGPEDFKKKS